MIKSILCINSNNINESNTTGYSKSNWKWSLWGKPVVVQTSPARTDLMWPSGTNLLTGSNHLKLYCRVVQHDFVVLLPCLSIFAMAQMKEQHSARESYW